MATEAQPARQAKRILLVEDELPAPTLFQKEAANLTRSLRCKVEPLPK